MDTIKIGKFIAESRKSVGLTQEELAEKLYITDRAVSKWERGLSLPDASKMLDLCEILNISVNELLNGERISMENTNEKAEELIIELAHQEESKNKKILLNVYVLLITSTIFYIALILVGCFTLEKGAKLGTLICGSTTFYVLIAFYVVKIEKDAGYYECMECHNKFIPSYFTSITAPHVFSKRHLKCPICHKKTWAKKIMSKK